MSETVAEEWGSTLAAGGVKRVYAVDSAAGNPLHDALQQDERLQYTGMPCGESAAFAAVGDALLSGHPVACCGRAGSGNLQMAAGLREASLSHAPVLALAPETRAGAAVCRDIVQASADYCSIASSPAEAATVLTAALRHARSGHTAGVVLLPAAMQQNSAPQPAPIFIGAAAVAEPAAEEVSRLAELLNTSQRIVFLCGRGCRGARDILKKLAQRLSAPIACTLRSRDFMEADNPYAVGVIGMLGWGDAPTAVQIADLLVIWGADFPYTDYLPSHGQVVQIDTDAEALGRHVSLCHAVHGDVKRTASLLLPLLRENNSEEFLTRSLTRHAKAVAEMEAALNLRNEHMPLRPEYITRLISNHAEPDAVFCPDAGSILVAAARYLQFFGRRRLIGSFGLGAAAAAIPMALGAKSASPSRQVVALCTPASLQRMWGVLLVATRRHLALKVAVFHTASSDTEPLTDNTGSSGVTLFRLSRADEAASTIRRWLATREPAVLEVTLEAHPPTLPPESDLLRTLRYQALPARPTEQLETEEIRRILFSSSFIYR